MPVQALRVVATGQVSISSHSFSITARSLTILQNGVGAFILQCKRLEFHYCDWAGSSKGMKYVRSLPLSTHFVFAPPPKCSLKTNPLFPTPAPSFNSSYPPSPPNILRSKCASHPTQVDIPLSAEATSMVEKRPSASGIWRRSRC